MPKSKSIRERVASLIGKKQTTELDIINAILKVCEKYHQPLEDVLKWSIPRLTIVLGLMAKEAKEQEKQNQNKSKGKGMRMMI